MEILVYGIGGVGGYFGGKLAKAGCKVSMIARGDHLKATRENGLEIKRINGDFKVRPQIITDDLEEVPKPDLVLLGVKSWQVKEVAHALRPKLKKNSMVLPLQNGANNAEKLLEILPRENVLEGLCYIVSFVEAPGKISHVSFEPQIIFGENNNSRSTRIKQVKELFDKAGIDNLIPEDIHLEVWKKFLFIASISGIGGLTRVSVDKIRENNYLFDLIRKTAEEISAVAKAKGIALRIGHLEKALELIKNQPRGTTASTQRDIMAGRPSELETFNGFVVKEGKKLGISTPVNRFIYECLLPMEEVARKS